MKRLAILFGLVALLLFALGCGGNGGGAESTADDDATPVDDDQNADDDADDDSTPGRAQVILPPYPFWPNDAYVVDENLIEDLATTYCAAHTGDASGDDFFYGDLPMGSFDLFYPQKASPAPESLMGDLYISGYFGGLWLRNVLSPRDARGLNLQIPFELLAGYTAQQIDLASTGADADVLAAARKHINLLLFVYGYNRGYLEQIIAHPPPGIAPPEGVLDCVAGQVLDCDSPGLAWPFIDRNEAAIAKLREPPNANWQTLADLTTNAENYVQMGAKVWQFIPIDQLNAASYGLLINLSLQFLMASKAAVLGEMTAWADDVPAEGRYGLLTDAGMITWAGSYFLGLMNLSAPDEFPQLICP